MDEDASSGTSWVEVPEPLCPCSVRHRAKLAALEALVLELERHRGRGRCIPTTLDTLALDDRLSQLHDRLAALVDLGQRPDPTPSVETRGDSIATESTGLAFTAALFRRSPPPESHPHRWTQIRQAYQALRRRRPAPFAAALSHLP